MDFQEISEIMTMHVDPLKQSAATSSLTNLAKVNFQENVNKTLHRGDQTYFLKMVSTNDLQVLFCLLIRMSQTLFKFCSSVGDF